MLPQAEFEGLVASARQDDELKRNEQEVTAKYGPVFTPQGIATLSADTFKAFLTPKENRHWSMLYFHGKKLTADLPRLKMALGVLIDETKPITSRIGEARKAMGGAGLGRAVFSAILLVAYPSRYGVWNSTSDGGLRQVGMHPSERVPGYDKMSTGNQYEHINRVLNELSKKYNVSLWALDHVWGRLKTPDESRLPVPSPEVSASLGAGFVSRFTLEADLEGFLVANWDKTELSAKLDLHTGEDGEVDGEQFYIAGVGKVDLLCTNKDGSGYTVIELKKGQSPDDTIGQVTRYMGWVKENLVKEGQSVRGIIIAADADPKLMHSLKVVPNVEVHIFTYKVEFNLSKKE